MPDRKEIEEQEGRITFARINELDVNPVKGQFDTAHLKEVHRRIFQDLSHHAPGEFRPDAPGHIKHRALEHSGERYHVPYASRSEVEGGLTKALQDLRGPAGLRGLNAEQFADRMAKLYGDLDYLHPFKEGNSRTLRAFTKQLAREAGYDFDLATLGTDAASRDRLYIARDKEVLQRAFPGLTEERVMKTETREAYEAHFQAYITLTRFKSADSLYQLTKECLRQPKCQGGTNLS